jgi:hypothetical protein
MLTEDHSPFAALLKATIINDTNWVNNKHAIADYDKIANIHPGFSLTNLTQSMPGKENS